MNDAVIGFLTCLPGAEQEKKNKKIIFLKIKFQLFYTSKKPGKTFIAGAVPCPAPCLRHCLPVKFNHGAPAS
jgi:hypothetical protein